MRGSKPARNLQLETLKPGTWHNLSWKIVPTVLTPHLMCRLTGINRNYE